LRNSAKGAARTAKQTEELIAPRSVLRVLIRSAKGAARTAKEVGNCFAPRLIVLACAFVSSAAAQVGGMGGYMGPGVLSRGAGDIGAVNGEQVDLRFFVNLNAVYDTGLQPFSLDSAGNLLRVAPLYGEQLSVGAYGTHNWRQASVGLDYTGNFYHYDNGSSYDGSTQNLMLGFTYQKNRRWSFDLREIAGTSSLGYGAPGFYGTTAVPSDVVVNQPTTLLFDNRTYWVQSGADANYIASARTIFTVGGDGYVLRRQETALAGLTGYTLRGSIQHRLTKTRTVGVSYQRMHYEFPPAFGQSDIDVATGFFNTSLGRRWIFSAALGMFHSEVKGLEQVALDPVIAALLGQSTGIRSFYRADIYPNGDISLTGRFKTSSVTFTYRQTAVPGNGVYLTSRNRYALASYSYTGIHKLNLGVSGGYTTLESIGQGIQPYSQMTGGAGFTYGVTRMLHVVGRYDLRHQELDVLNTLRTSYRATLGIAFSPGNIPLSLW